MVQTREARGTAPGRARSARKPKKRVVQHKSAPPEKTTQTLKYFLLRTSPIPLADVAASFGMSKGQLAETAGFKPETFQRTERAAAPKTQARIREMLEIVGRVADWAGGKEQAMAWYRAEPLPAFGGRTAEALVKEG